MRCAGRSNLDLLWKGKFGEIDKTVPRTVPLSSTLVADLADGPALETMPQSLNRTWAAVAGLLSVSRANSLKIDPNRGKEEKLRSGNSQSAASFILAGVRESPADGGRLQEAPLR